MTQKPPIQLPSNSLPAIDGRGIWTPAWYAFFANLVSPATPIEAVTVGLSPYTYTAVHPGALLVQGGVLTALHFVRARIDLDITGITGFIPVSQGDQLVFTYTGVPTLNFIPNGDPA